jgi:UDP-N-acetylmuramate: L-alanyl-gamma-D-glutamyl-meso-diaminopimelate ligase
MNVHFIAIGGAVMHNMAIALHLKGYTVSGSDDEIFEPAKSNLARHGLLPNETGWLTEKITSSLDAVILGMHARADNPELLRAKELGVKIYSFPEYVFEQSKNKKRVVIGGSHGKTSITAMIMHVLHHYGMDFDYLVGSQLKGFDTMVRITEAAPVMVVEGDEYLTSPLDLRPKFHLYHPHTALLSGVAWDHINVFPTFENYLDQFRIFINLIEAGGKLIYCKEDEHLCNLVKEIRNDITLLPYGMPVHSIKNGVTEVVSEGNSYTLEIFGNHNLMNLEGARLICNDLGISNHNFFAAISTFAGAAKRLELIAKNETCNVYKDFAHSPSKLKATVEAVKSQFPERILVGCMELHTFSSLNKDFLSQYHGAMDACDIAIVYYNNHTIEHKKLPPVSEQEVMAAFGKAGLIVLTDSAALVQKLKSMSYSNANLLMMSSGNFDGINLVELSQSLLKA